MNIEYKNLLNDQGFISLSSKLENNQFTVFDVLKNADYEIRHSNVLAWLFDQTEKHGIKNLFLIKFIENLFSVDANEMILNELACANGCLIKKQRNQRIELSKLKYKVYREREYFDILIEDKSAKFILLIENKPGMETEGQLANYRNKIDSLYPEDEYIRLFVFLTVDGTPPNNQAERERWLTFSYNSIVSIIEETIIMNIRLDEEKSRIRIIDFLEQYAHNLRTNLLRTGYLAEAEGLHQKYPKVFSEITQGNIDKSFFTKQEWNAIVYVITCRSEIHYKLLTYCKNRINGSYKIRHAPNQRHQWLNFYSDKLLELFKEKGFNDTPPFLSIDKSKDNGIEFALWYITKSAFGEKLNHAVLQSSILCDVLYSDYYSTKLYTMQLLSPDDIVNNTYEELCRIIDAKLQKDIPEIIANIENEMNGLGDLL